MIPNVIDPGSEEGKKLGALHDKDNLLRGRYLIQAIVIEGIIGDIIALSLCPNVDSRSLFTSLILNYREFTFEGKCQILKRLMELKYPTIVNKHKDIFGQINKVKEFRNKLAHCMLDTSDDFLAKNYTDRIQLRYYDKGQMQTKEITDTDMSEKLSSCTKLVIELDGIRCEITQPKTM
jgi:hypothetical protein